MTRRLPIGLTVATAIALAILCGLGGWQLKRLAWKNDLIARIEATRTAAPKPITAVPLTPAYRFTRVTLDCPGLATAKFVELYALRNGRAGTRLISLCKYRERSRPVLVDRGFVPDTISARPPVAAGAEPVHLTGVLRDVALPGPFTPSPQDGRFYAADLHGMGIALGAPRGGVSLVMVSAETSSNPEWPALTPTGVPTDIPNRHLEYALTWFGLAGALLAVYAALVRRRMKAP